MTLSLIVGPPNSGRTGLILDSFRDARARDPVLVVPTLDDAERFERELTEPGGAVVGATVCTFNRLFDLVATIVDTPSPPRLSEVQRRRVAREAVARTDGLRLLRASSRRQGFPAALDELIGDLQAARVDPATLAERAAEAGPYEAEVARLYESYCAIRAELGRSDSHSLAAGSIAALRERPDAWGSRPLFLYGFDDLTAEQLELVHVLVGACEVTIALPWEDRAVLTDARGSLFAELREMAGSAVTHLGPNPAFTKSKSLYEVERRFGERAGQHPARVEPDGGVVLVASSGELAEAEAVGAEVARLLDDGTPAGEIAVVLRQPDALGPLYRRVFDRFAIPVAVQADLAVTRTLTGTGLISLLQAAIGSRTAADVLGYLRTPGIDAPNRVDWFERRVLRRRMRDADEAIGDWDAGENRRALAEIARLREASGSELLREAARQARWLAEGAQRSEGAVATDDRALELRAGAEIERRLLELAELGLGVEPADVIAAVGEMAVPLWRGPTEGRVRVISPYRARARRVRHLFICSMQDGDFPRRDTGGPLLSDEARQALALRPRVKAEAEDRYLFAAALSRPTERVWLSWRPADDEGGATARSPFVDEVRDLLDPPLPDDVEERDEMLVAEARGRGIAESVFAPGSAPTEDELARALAGGMAASNGDGAARGEVPADVRERVDARLAAAVASTSPERLKPGPIKVGPVKAQMSAKTLFGPSTLEEFATCPYRWFVDHELRPQGIEPDSDALTAGGIAHHVLEHLYRDQPGGDRRPTAANLDAWRARASELVRETGAEWLPGERSDTAATLRRTEGLVLAFIEDEAATDIAYTPEPSLAEASFGFDDSEKPAYPISPSAAIHGRIDRIDFGPSGEALVQDYKTGAKVEGGAKMLERGKFQLQLYLLAVRELWQLELAGGLYRPLGGTSNRQPKGLLRKAVQPDLEPLDPRPGDHLEDERFEQVLEDARARAAELASEIQDGDIGRRPIKQKCPDYCNFQPICRRERGLPEDEPSGEGDENGGGE
jgi:ATP-dependent helicase/DNAse subunit B